MIKTQLFCSGECIGERKWTAIPRLTENVFLSDPRGAFTVAQVDWIDSSENFVARIHLKRHDDPAIT
ncbi:MAG TPA: hypothetical protein VHN11_02230 [Xanthobacteraceae bacterium]|nr:hypothetical protein [Xanthobacteraceae bacterium]